MELYNLVLKVWQHFGTDLMLGQVYHCFMSQKSESLHQQITHMAPKDKHFSSSMSLLDCISLVIITDSVGYECGMEMIFNEIGLQMPPVTKQYLICRNDHRQYDCKYHKHLDVKNCHYVAKKENIEKTWNKKWLMQGYVWFTALELILLALKISL